MKTRRESNVPEVRRKGTQCALGPPIGHYKELLAHERLDPDLYHPFAHDRGHIVSIDTRSAGIGVSLCRAHWGRIDAPGKYLDMHILRSHKGRISVSAANSVGSEPWDWLSRWRGRN